MPHQVFLGIAGHFDHGRVDEAHLIFLNDGQALQRAVDQGVIGFFGLFALGDILGSANYLNDLAVLPQNGG